MASLRENDGLATDHSPWLASLVVDPAYQGKGIGKQLIDAIKQQAKSLGYLELYLLDFDPTIPSWHWNKRRMLFSSLGNNGGHFW